MPQSRLGLCILVALACARTPPAPTSAPARPVGPALAPQPISPPAHAAYERGFIRDTAVVYANGKEHAENVELYPLPAGQMLLAFRGGGTGQTETPDARIRVYTFDPQSYAGTLRGEIAAAPASPPRGIRDPKLFSWQGKLRLTAISRQAGFPIRDLASQARTVWAESPDEGATFTTPAPSRFSGTQDPTFGIWRTTARPGEAGVLYATGYNDGDLEAALFSSRDGGESFEKLGSIVNSPADVPSEAELFFIGEKPDTAVSLVRLDNQGLLSNGQTAICTLRAGAAGFRGDFSCPRRLEQRLDGPSPPIEVDGRRFVIARKHLACTRKRTAVYELRGDLADPAAKVSLCEIAELPSSGDTAYVAIQPLPGADKEYVAAWYSTPLGTDLPWLPAQFAPSVIVAAKLDFKKYDPAWCQPPAPDPLCPAPPLPRARRTALDGQYLFTLAPSFFPDLPAFFTAIATTKGDTLTLRLVPLDQQAFIDKTPTPLGEGFEAKGTIGKDGTFTLDFGNPTVPFATYPLGGKMPVTFTLEGLKVRGVTRSADAFCGGVEGAVVVTPIPGVIPPGTKLLLEGSSFGAARSEVVKGCS